MRKATTRKKKADAVPLVIEASLSPANAVERCGEVLSAMEKARRSKTSFTLGLDGPEASPCALQILIAASRSARKHDSPFELSKEAKAALAEINLD